MPAIVNQLSATDGPGARPDDKTTASEGREPRESVLLAASVSRFGNPAVFQHRLRDVSPNGARLDKAAGLRRGETILISVGSLAAIGATVIWVDNGAAGVKFFETIDPNAARSKTFVKVASASPDLAPTTPSAERTAQLTGWLANLESAYA